MKNLFLVYFCVCTTIIGFSQTTINYQQVSEDLLFRLMNKQDFSKEINLLANSPLEDLSNQLSNDSQKFAFWMNIYNGLIQKTLLQNPEEFNNRSSFYKKKRVKIGGQLLSFDDIEHGILRKSVYKISLGYIRKPFRPKWERKLRVNNIDWRIHFALNCGAKSCPPVAIYSSKHVNKELDFMAKEYLMAQTTCDTETNSATTVALISWFRGDFGGLSGAKRILKDYKICPSKPKKLSFASYDWTLLLGNYRSLPDF